MCGAAQPPFNTQARAEAGFGEGWYMPLAAPAEPAAPAAGPQHVASNVAARPPPTPVTAAFA